MSTVIDLDLLADLIRAAKICDRTLRLCGVDVTTTDDGPNFTIDPQKINMGIDATPLSELFLSIASRLKPSPQKPKIRRNSISSCPETTRPGIKQLLKPRVGKTNSETDSCANAKVGLKIRVGCPKFHTRWFHINYLVSNKWAWSASEDDLDFWECSIKASDFVEKPDPHTNYQICTKISKSLFNQEIGSLSTLRYSRDSEENIQVYRRFNHFKTLYEFLENSYTGLCIPCLPPDDIRKNREEVVNYRISKLNAWLKYLASHPVLRRDCILLNFITLDTEEWAKLNMEPKPGLDARSVRQPRSLLSVSPTRVDSILDKVKYFRKTVDSLMRNLKNQRKLNGGLSKVYGLCGNHIKDLASFFEDNSKSFLDILSRGFRESADIISNREKNYLNNLRHFDDVISSMEESGALVDKLPKIAAVVRHDISERGKNKDTSSLFAGCRLDAEFNYVLENRINVLNIKLIIFFNEFADFLKNDMSLCQQIADALRLIIPH